MDVPSIPPLENVFCREGKKKENSLRQMLQGLAAPLALPC
jgi:hypothetical protein